MGKVFNTVPKVTIASYYRLLVVDCVADSLYSILLS